MWITLAQFSDFVYNIPRHMRLFGIALPKSQFRVAFLNHARGLLLNPDFTAYCTNYCFGATSRRTTQGVLALLAA